MPRTLVMCCDGTSNEFGVCNTNVVRLVQVLADQPPGSQIVYYDPGIGTLPEPGVWTAVGKAVSESFDLAFATGLAAKVGRAYSYLADTWQPGDRVFLFGFSRGAYTARVIAAMLHALGLLPPRTSNLVPYAVRLFASARQARGTGGQSPYWRLSNQFRKTFARPLPDEPTRRFPVAFVGLWDTVSSVGWVWDPASFPYTANNPSLGVVRHAIALDERRCFFQQNRFASDRGQDVQERWFAGGHSDVGGGYPELSGASWRPSFEWIVTEAMRQGLVVDERQLARHLDQPDPSPTWNAPLHDTLRGPWLAAELFPKLRYDRVTRRTRPRLGLGRSREVEAGEMLHRSLLERIYHTDYAPRNLSAAFMAKVRTAVPTGDRPYEP